MESIINKLQEIISAYPDVKAVIDGGDGSGFTYAQFGEYAGKIAAKLLRKGVKPGDFVMIMLPRNKEYIAAMYASWLVGAGFAPLSPAYPPERIEYIKNDCRAVAVIDERFLRGVSSEQPLTQTLEHKPEDPAILIYTSGSTGNPKGVLHSQRSITDSVFRYMDYANTPVGFRAAIGAPFTFVASVQGVFAPLCAGNTAILIPYEAMRDPELLAETIEKQKINRCFISPKMLKVFKPKGDSLKVVSTGSERVTDLFSKAFTIQVAYGQTESAGAVMMFEIDKKYENLCRQSLCRAGRLSEAAAHRRYRQNGRERQLYLSEPQRLDGEDQRSARGAGRDRGNHQEHRRRF